LSHRALPSPSLVAFTRALAAVSSPDGIDIEVVAVVRVVLRAVRLSSVIGGDSASASCIDARCDRFKVFGVDAFAVQAIHTPGAARVCVVAPVVELKTLRHGTIDVPPTPDLSADGCNTRPSKVSVAVFVAAASPKPAPISLLDKREESIRYRLHSSIPMPSLGSRPLGRAS
jgi:hypothetical protein